MWYFSLPTLKSVTSQSNFMRLHIWFSFFIILFASFCVSLPSAQANPKYASIVIDAETGTILREENASLKRYPASLTKIMTLMMAFEAIENGQTTMNSHVKISQRAANAVPSKLGLRPGSTIKLKDAILALVTKSANDIAVAVAEHVAGSEDNFARLMTRRARQIGMSNTTFKNAHGLHNSRQVTTARDMAKLAQYMYFRYPQYYKLFSTRSFTYQGKTYNNHNRLLGKYKGMDGLKTGYINASGFNLVASAERGNKRIIGVVFGGRTATTRNNHMVEILDDGFGKLRNTRYVLANPPKPVTKPNHLRDDLYFAQTDNMLPASNDAIGQKILAQGDADEATMRRLEAAYIAQQAHTSDDSFDVASLTQDQGVSRNWSIQIGAFQSRVATDAALKTAQSLLPSDLRYGRTIVSPLKTSNAQWVYRARINGYSRTDAERACKHFRDCLAIAPEK
tara:strand:+ start:1408 stop:2763 length:1356 start_codon:yes stop_codon:yes gene_type:complete